VRNFLAMLVEKKSTHVLRRIEAFEILPQSGRAALFKGSDRIVEDADPKRLPGRVAGTKRERDQNRQHHEQSLRHPEREKYFQEKALHALAFSRGRAKI